MLRDEHRRWSWAGVVLAGALVGCDLLPGRGTDTAANTARPGASDTTSAGATTPTAGRQGSGARATRSREAGHFSRNAGAASAASRDAGPTPASSTAVFPPPDYTATPPATPAAPATDPVLTTMRSDLRRLVVAQKQHFANQGQFSDRLSALAIRYLPHSGVSVQITSAGPSGWSGRATYEGRPGASCVIWIGSVPRPATDAQHRAPPAVGEPVCDSL